MDLKLDRFRELFFQESQGHLDTMSTALVALESNPLNLDELASFYRAAHSIRTASRTFGFSSISNLTQALENLLGRIRNGAIDASRERREVMAEAVDALRELLATAASGRRSDAEVEHLRAQLTVAQRAGRFRPEQPPRLRSADGVKVPYAVYFRPNSEILRHGFDPGLIIRELANRTGIRSLEADLSALPPLGALDPEKFWVAWKVRLATDLTEPELRDLFSFAEDGADLSIGVDTSSAPALTGVLRVSSGKVGELIDLVSRLRSAQSDAATLLDGFDASNIEQLRTVFAEIERYAHGLEQCVLPPSDADRRQTA
jgi:two-component system chemotaxis sensor kinase CheA